MLMQLFPSGGAYVRVPTTTQARDLSGIRAGNQFSYSVDVNAFVFGTRWTSLIQQKLPAKKSEPF
jgi:hypothetical protein